MYMSILVELTCGTPSQSSACCMASLVLLTRCTASQLSQSGHKPVEAQTIILFPFQHMRSLKKTI